jgi:hypothetical protein
MSKVVTTEYICDRCKGPVVKECGLIIEDVSMSISGYDPRGSGGTTVRGLEFCYSCSRQLHEWLNNRAGFVVVAEKGGDNAPD